MEQHRNHTICAVDELVSDTDKIKYPVDEQEPVWDLEHVMQRFCFYDGQTLCTIIIADFTSQQIWIQNECDSLIKTAFGNNLTPSWVDFQSFLEDRCIPWQRAGLREYLKGIGVDRYDPLQIIAKTAGRMAEDDQWLKVEVMK